MPDDQGASASSRRQAQRRRNAVQQALAAAVAAAFAELDRFGDAGDPTFAVRTRGDGWLITTSFRTRSDDVLVEYVALVPTEEYGGRDLDFSAQLYASGLGEDLVTKLPKRPRERSHYRLGPEY